MIIAGPCAAETREQVMTTALSLAKIKGIDIFRASVWKPRTRFGTFEGVGEKGLQWLAEVKREVGFLVATEINLPSNVDLLLKHGIDVAWIGARSSCNPFLMNEFATALAGTGLQVMVKNPICPDVDLWIGSIERLQHAGIQNITAIHRGFMQWGYQGIYRNAPLWELVEQFKERKADIPLICDPSHIAGRSDLVSQVMQESKARGVTGFMIESHCCPTEALSDARQQLTPDVLREVLARI